MVRFDERGVHFAQKLSYVSASGRPQDQLQVEQGIPKHIPNYHQGIIFSSPPPASEATVRSQKQSLPSQKHDSRTKEVLRSYFTGSPDQETIRYGNCISNLESQGLHSFTNEFHSHQESITSIRNDITNPDLKVNLQSTAIPDQQTQTQQELLYQQQLHRQEQLKLTQIQAKLELQRINQQERQHKELQQQQIQQQRLQQEQQLQELQQQELQEQQKLAELEQEDILTILEELLIQSNSIYKTTSTTLEPNMHSSNSQSSSQVQPSDKNENNKHNSSEATEESSTSNCPVIEIPMLPELQVSLLPSSVTPNENSLSVSQESARSSSSKESNTPVVNQISDGQSDSENSNNIYPDKDTGSLQNNQVVNKAHVSGTQQMPADLLQHKETNHLQELIGPFGGPQTPTVKKRGRSRSSKASVNKSQIPPKVQKVSEHNRQGRSDPSFPPHPAGGYPQYSGYLQQPSDSTQQFRCAQQPGSVQQSGHAQQPGFVQQAGYIQQSAYAQQFAYFQQSGYTQQFGYSQPRYSQQTSGYPQQLPGYPQNFGYPQQIFRYTQQLPGYTKPIPKPDSRQDSRLGNLPGPTPQLPQFSGSIQVQHQNIQHLPQSLQQLPQNMQQLPQNMQQLSQSMQQLPQSKQQFPNLRQQLPRYSEPLLQQFPQYVSQFPSFHEELFKYAQEGPQYRRNLPEYADQLSTSNQQLTSQIHGYPGLTQFCTQSSQICSQGKQLFGVDRNIPAQSQSFPAQNQQVRCQRQQEPSQNQQVLVQRQQVFVQSQLVHLQTQQVPSQNQQVLVQRQKVFEQSQRVPLQTQQVSFQSQQALSQNQQVLVQSHQVPVQSQPVPAQNQEAPVQSQQMLDQVPQYPILTQQFPNQNQPFSGKLKRLLEGTPLSQNAPSQYIPSPTQRLSSPTQHLSSPIQGLSNEIQRVSSLVGYYLNPLQLNATPEKHPSTRAEQLPNNSQQFSPIDPNFQSQKAPQETLDVSNEEPTSLKPKSFRSWHIPEDLPPSENNLESSERIESSLIEQPDEIKNSEETPSLSIDENSIVFENPDIKVIQQLPSPVEVTIETWAPTMSLDTASRMHDFEEELQTIGLQETQELQETEELQQTEELQEIQELQETNELQQQDSQQTNELGQRNELEQEQIVQAPVNDATVDVEIVEIVETRQWILESPPQLVIDFPTESEKPKGIRCKSYKPHKRLRATINRYRAKGIPIRSPPEEIFLKEAAKNKDFDERKKNANSSKTDSKTSNAQDNIDGRQMPREFTPSEIHHHGLPNLQRLLTKSDGHQKKRIKKKKEQEDPKKNDNDVGSIISNK